ncbi:hypothetical protein HX836_23200 [Pseudomonas yamanorum]|uniref:phospholipase D family protein n=1 Tax=Pseudomonas yamanorum TaxID=515393 RepID=UPI0015A20BBA|nr:phospholipase D family protein [Pseudomonas yamanorum]NVZ84722.1 hypothetical protein [Pseudomonas yamanorum]
MFVAPADYKDQLKSLIAEEQNLDFAVAFWGDGAENLIPLNAARSVRIICNLRTGGTNPAVVRYFLSKIKDGNSSLQIKHSSHLHAKVVVGQNQALIGSANMSTNGLGLEDGGLARWMEAGIHTRDSQEVASAHEWFNSLWESDDVSTIADEDLLAAQIAWDRKQNARPPLDGDPRAPFTMGRFSVDELKGRPAYVTIYRKWLSKEARAAQEAEEQSAVSAMKDAGKIRWWAYECWDGLPQAPAEMIGIYWGTRGKLLVEGVCRLLESDSVPFTYDNGDEGWIELAAPKKQLLGRPFDIKDAKALQAELTDFIDVLWHKAVKTENGEYACVIHLAEMVRVWGEWRSASEAP